MQVEDQNFKSSVSRSSAVVPVLHGKEATTHSYAMMSNLQHIPFISLPHLGNHLEKINYRKQAYLRWK